MWDKVQQLLPSSTCCTQPEVLAGWGRQCMSHTLECRPGRDTHLIRVDEVQQLGVLLAQLLQHRLQDLWLRLKGRTRWRAA